MSMIWEGGQAVCEERSLKSDAKLTLKSNGWSGKIVNAHDPDLSARQFQLDVDFETYGNDGWFPGITGSVKTTPDNIGSVWYQANSNSPIIVGISLEHMGWISNPNGTAEEGVVQFLGKIVSGGSVQNVYAWGGKENENVLSVLFDWIMINNYDWNSPYEAGLSGTVATDTYIQNVSCGANIQPFSMVCNDGGNWPRHYDCTITTDLPIFATDADLLEFIQSGGTDTSKILNIGGEPDPEEEYEQQFQYWYVKNRWGHNTRNVAGYASNRNYRFYPKRKGICFIKHTPTSEEPYDRILYNYSGYTAKIAVWGADSDEDFVDYHGEVWTDYLTKSISFGSNDYYTKFEFDTNIPLWNNQQDADDYYNGLKDISEADNYAYISRQDANILNPDLPGTEEDETTAMRTNGMRFSYGVRLYEITNIELANLMQEMFDPANVQDVIDGNKLFGANTMSAVSGVMYLPFADLSEICEMGSEANIIIGSWESQTARGKRIIKNEGTIDCGSFFYNRTYLDYRDYEPYSLLFVNLPFCGCHQLTISKYLDKTVNVSYNVDVCTGGIVAKLTADGILVDIFEGTCGASRPISATDNNAYINSIVGAITGASASASGSIEGITNSVSNVGKAAAGGSALAAGGATLGAVGVAGAAGASGVYTAYQVKNAVDNPPQMHRGSLAGNLGYYLNSKPTFLFFTKRSIRPENELETIGYPSGHGGAVGSFSGFLSCSAFKLADGFNGTDEERAEIMEIMRGGIYL